MFRLTVLLLCLAAPLAAAQTPDTLAYDRPPEAVTRVAPVYPDSAAQAGLEGRVYVRAFVGLDSLAARVEVVRGVHPLLDSSAVQAVRQWRFRPAEKAGVPVTAWLTLPVRFRLPDAAEPPPVLSFVSQPGRGRAGFGVADSAGCRIILPLEPTHYEQPEYAANEQLRGRDGRVVSWVTVSPQGRVTGIEVVEATDPDFARSASTALARWRFRPAQCDGALREARVQIPIRFRTNGGSALPPIRRY